MSERRLETFLRACAEALEARTEAALLRAVARAVAATFGASRCAITFADGAATQTAVWPARPRGGRNPATEIRLRFRGGEARWPRTATADTVAGLRAAIAAGLELAAAAWRRARREARLDPLTGLPNRAALEDELGRLWSAAVRHSEPLALGVADVDGFKAWNDRRGHDAGDRALRRVARTLRGSCRACDLVARWGGDEFVLALPRTDRAGAAALERRLADRLRNPSVTIGWAVYPEDGATSAAALRRRADAALRRARRGKGGERKTEKGK